MEPEALSVMRQVVWAGFGLAVLLGAITKKTDFCTLGAVYDLVRLKRRGRMRGWLLAIAVAIIGTNLLELMGWVNLADSIYQSARLRWLSNLVGGMIFGVGMVYAIGCGQRTLVRIGGGNLRALVIILVMAISAYMTLRGLFGLWRIEYLDAVNIDLSRYGKDGQDLTSLFAGAFGLSHTALQIALSTVTAGALLLFVFRDRGFLRDTDNLVAGIAVGLLVVAAWYLTGHMAYYDDGLETFYLATNTQGPESYTFIAPVAFALEFFMLYTDVSTVATFGIVTVFGVILGSFLWSIVSGTFQWEGFRDIADIRKALLAGVLMGFGGVTAMGCTIGQGITGISTLAVGSVITWIGIVAGATLTYKLPGWWLNFQMNNEEWIENRLGLLKRK